MKQLFVSLLIAFTVLLSGSCSEKEDPMLCDYENEYEAYSRHLERWASNPTGTTCEALKKSAVDLLNKLRGCPGVGGIEDGIEEWRDLDCNPFDLLQ